MKPNGRDRRFQSGGLLAPRLLPFDERRFQWRFTLLATLLLIVIVIAIACGQGGGDSGPSAGSPVPLENATPPPSACGPGLAAVDLAGNCRAQPNPTPGALEAVN